MTRRDIKWDKAAELVLVMALAALLMLYGLDGTAHRGRYDDVDRALVARNMADGGDWLVPQLRGRDLLTKPPLMYWTAAGLERLTGRRDELPGNLTSVLCMLVVVGCTWGVGALLFDHRAGLRAGMILATMVSFLDLSRHTLLDTVLVAWMMVTILALTALARLGKSPSHTLLWWLVGTVGLAGTILAKGPVGLPVLVLVAGPLFWRSPPRRLAWWQEVLLAGLLLALVLPWFVLVLQRVPEASEVWRVELLGRMGQDELTGSWPTHPFWYYGPQLAGTLPWLPLVLAGAAFAWSRRQVREWRTLLVWAVGGLLFLSLASSSKRSFYLLPLFPAMALMVAGAWPAWFPAGQKPARLANFMLYAVAALVLVAAIGFMVLPIAFERVPGGVFLLAGGCALAGAIFALAGLRSGWPNRAFGGIVGGAAVLYLAWFGHLVPRENSALSGKPFLEEAALRIDESGVILCEVPVPLTLFYLDSPTYLNEPRPMVLQRMRENPRRLLVTRPEVAATIGHLRPVLEDTMVAPLGQDNPLGLYKLAPSAPD